MKIFKQIGTRHMKIFKQRGTRHMKIFKQRGTRARFFSKQTNPGAVENQNYTYRVQRNYLDTASIYHGVTCRVPRIKWMTTSNIFFKFKIVLNKKV